MAMRSENIVFNVVWRRTTLAYTAVCRWPWASRSGGNGAAGY